MAEVQFRLAVGAGFAAWFWTIYPLADWWTGRQVDLPSAKIALDAAIPFLPQLAPVYLSMSALLILPLVLSPIDDLMALACTMAGQVAVAGIIYVLWPVAPSAHPIGEVPGLFDLADKMNLTYNSVPSLHVVLSLTIALVLARWWAMTWAVAITLSSLLTHQHYLIDVASGVVLAAAGIAAYPAIKRRVKKSAMSRRISGI